LAALLKAKAQFLEQAAKLQVLAQQSPHMAHSMFWKDIADRHLTALVGNLPPELLKKARNSVADCDPWKTIESLLLAYNTINSLSKTQE
jgi:hypothetical protein